MAELTTPRLGLPLLAAGQAQKELFHNEALTRVDSLLHGHASGFNVDTPPESPEIGGCWIVGPMPEGDWEGHASEVACWTEGGWRFLHPCEGMQIWLGETHGFAIFFNGLWTSEALYGRVFVEGNQIIGPRLSAIAEPSGGMVVDGEARAAISSILLAMRDHGLLDGS